jgi:hypothetical protein
MNGCKCFVLACGMTLSLMAAAGGCNSNGPKVSGIGLLGNRNVTVDDIVDMRVPFDQSTGAEWRLASYDSALLQLIERPQVMPGSREGLYELVARFRARVPGDTEVMFQRTRPVAGETNERKFTISIHSR